MPHLKSRMQINGILKCHLTPHKITLEGILVNSRLSGISVGKRIVRCKLVASAINTKPPLSLSFQLVRNVN